MRYAWHSYANARLRNAFQSGLLDPGQSVVAVGS